MPPSFVEKSERGYTSTRILWCEAPGRVGRERFPGEQRVGRFGYVELDTAMPDGAAFSDGVLFVYVQLADAGESDSPDPAFVQAVLAHLDPLPDPASPHATALSTLLLLLERHGHRLSESGKAALSGWPETDLFEGKRFDDVNASLARRRGSTVERAVKRFLKGVDPSDSGQLLYLRSELAAKGVDPTGVLSWVVKDPYHALVQETLDEIERVPDATQILVRAAFRAVRRERWSGAQVLYDRLVPRSDADLESLNNALYCIDSDNTGRPVPEARARVYLERALKHGEENPSIFFNAACVLMQMGQRGAAITAIRDAIRFGYKDAPKLRADPTLRQLSGDPEFERALGPYAKSHPPIEPVDAPYLVELARELGGAPFAEQTRETLAAPPMRTQDVGFYGAERNPPLENCVRWMVSVLSKEGRLMAAEDKYVLEIFDQFARHIEVPTNWAELLPFYFDPDYDWEKAASDPGGQQAVFLKIQAGFMQACAKTERAFEAAGKHLLTFELSGGDHLYFIALLPEVAARWSGVALGQTYRGEPLGLRAPDWESFAQHLAYAIGMGSSVDALVTDPIRWRQP